MSNVRDEAYFMNPQDTALELLGSSDRKHSSSYDMELSSSQICLEIENGLPLDLPITEKWMQRIMTGAFVKVVEVCVWTQFPHSLIVHVESREEGFPR